MDPKIKNSFLYRLDPRTKILMLLVFIVVGCSVRDPFVTAPTVFPTSRCGS